MEKSNYKSNLPFELKAEVCSVIIDTGFVGSAEDYTRQYYGKSFEELTQVEAEMIVATLKDKKGCLADKEVDPFTKEAL